MATIPTNDELNSKLLVLQGELDTLKTTVSSMESNLRATFAARVDLESTDSSITSNVEDIAARVAELEDRYTTIKSPTATRWYLTQEEVDELKDILQTFNSILTDIQIVQENVVAIASRLEE